MFIKALKIAKKGRAITRASKQARAFTRLALHSALTFKRAFSKFKRARASHRTRMSCNSVFQYKNDKDYDERACNYDNLILLNDEV